MRHQSSVVRGMCVGLACLALVSLAHFAQSDESAKKVWMKPKLPATTDLTSSGKNPYFILEPGYQLTLKTKDGTDSLIITVLKETKVVDGVETRIIEERETKGGKLAEVSRNFFAISRSTNDLFYFGEEVDTYKDDKIDGHGGAWLAGVDGAKPGMMLPGKPEVGMRFYQEQAPKVAEDRSEIVSLSETLTTPAGKFTNCLKVVDDSAIEKGEADSKLYAPGVGLIQDEEFILVKSGAMAESK
jgi:hypothetical protein